MENRLRCESGVRTRLVPQLRKVFVCDPLFTFGFVHLLYPTFLLFLPLQCVLVLTHCNYVFTSDV